MAALDITNPDRMHGIIKVCRPGVAVHLAASVPTSGAGAAAVECFDWVNHGGEQNLVELVQNVGIELFICTSSISVHAAVLRGGVASHENEVLDPCWAYGSHNAAAEILLASEPSNQCAVDRLRFFGVCVPALRSGMSLRCCQATRDSATVNVCEPGPLFNFLWRWNAARACHAALETLLLLDDHVPNIAGDVLLSLQDLTRQIVSGMNFNSALIRGDGPGRPQVMDISAARKDLRFTPANLSQLLGALCDER